MSIDFKSKTDEELLQILKAAYTTLKDRASNSKNRENNNILEIIGIVLKLDKIVNKQPSKESHVEKKYKTSIGKKLRSLLKPKNDLLLKLVTQDRQKFVQISSEVEFAYDPVLKYFHTGNHRKPPKTLEIEISKTYVKSKDLIKTKTMLLELLDEICQDNDNISIPINKLK